MRTIYIPETLCLKVIKMTDAYSINIGVQFITRITKVTI